MKNLSLLLISILFFSCQKKENSSIHKNENAPISVDSSMTISKEEKKQDNKQIGDTISLNFSNEKNMFSAEGRLDSINSKVYVKFKNENSGLLKAEIIPEAGKGNIRFNQIISPDKTSDGPFGMDLTIPIQQKGNYVLVIGHSLMADNPYYGKFKVQLEIKKE